MTKGETKENKIARRRLKNHLSHSLHRTTPIHLSPKSQPKVARMPSAISGSLNTSTSSDADRREEGLDGDAEGQGLKEEDDDDADADADAATPPMDAHAHLHVPPPAHALVPNSADGPSSPHPTPPLLLGSPLQ